MREATATALVTSEAPARDGDVPVIPVVVIDQVADAVPLGRALVSGGLEATLRP